MKILGIRCSSKDFSFSIVTGKQDNPSLIDSETIKYPKGYSDADKMKWFYQEIGGLIAKYEIYGIGIKGTEPMAMKGKLYGERMQMEGMAYLQAAENSINYIKRKVKSTIAKHLGLKGKGKYLATKVDYSKISETTRKIQKFKNQFRWH